MIGTSSASAGSDKGLWQSIERQTAAGGPQSELRDAQWGSCWRFFIFFGGWRLRESFLPNLQHPTPATTFSCSQRIQQAGGKEYDEVLV